MSGAKFKIRNITTGGAWSLFADGGFDVSNSDVFEIQLEDLPALDVQSLTVSVVVTSKDADDLDFPGASATTYSPASPTSAFQVTAPASGAHSWLLRAQTNGGAAVAGVDGKPDWTVNTKERIVAIRTPNANLRKGVIAETGQYSPGGGWMDAQNELVDEVDAALGTILSAVQAVAVVEPIYDDGADAQHPRVNVRAATTSTRGTLSTGHIDVLTRNAAARLYEGSSSVAGIGFDDSAGTGLSYSAAWNALLLLANSSPTVRVTASGMTIAPVAQSSGSPVALSIQPPLHSGIANAESYTAAFLAPNPIRFTGGATIATMRSVFIAAPDYRMTSAGTITGACTLAIAGAPTSGDATVTYTNGPWALWVQGGTSKFEGAIGCYAGSAAAPGLSTYGDLDTGWHWPGANSMSAACGGSNVLTMTATTITVVVEQVVAGARRLTGRISPTALGGSVNNYAPGSLSTASVIRQDCSAASEITGLTGGADGREMTIFNVATNPVFTLTLRHDDGVTSTAANRFLLPGGGSLVILAGGCVILWYDSVSSRWRARSAT